MRFSDLLRLSTRIFKTRATRTFLTIFGMAVGIGAILFLVSLGYGMQRVIHARIIIAEALLSLSIVPVEPDVFILDQLVVDRVLEIPNVEEVSPKAEITGQAIQEGLISEISIRGVNPGYFPLAGIVPYLGEFFQEPDEKKVVLSSRLVRSFGVEPEQILGTKVEFVFFLPQEQGIREERGEFPFQVSGVIEDEVVAFAYFHLDTLKDLGIENYTEMKVRVADTKYLQEVSEELVDRGFLVSALADVVQEADRVFRIIQIVLAVLGLIALVVAAIGMVNTMTVALLERTNEIGVMKSIGASDKDVGKIFVFESVIMGFLGGLAGVGLGLLVAKLFNHLLNMLALALGGVPVDVFFTPLWFIIFIIVFSIVVGFFTGIYPARRAAKLNPLQALRYR